MRKTINNRQYNFGSFKSIEEAQRHIEFLENENWNTKYSKQYVNDLPKYIIHGYKNKYIIQKSINGKITKFGTFNTLEEATHERDLLIKYNWNYDLLTNCEYTI